MMEQSKRQALAKLGIPVWRPRSVGEAQASTAPAAVSNDSRPQVRCIYQGESPLMAVWVDCWGLQAKKLIANIVRCLQLPLTRICILANSDFVDFPLVGMAEFEDHQLSLLLAFDQAPPLVVDCLQPAAYVSVASLEQLLLQPQLKQRVLHDIWKYRFAID